MKKRNIRLITITIIIVGIILQFLRLFFEDIKWILYIGIPIMCLGITLFVNTFDFNRNHNKITVENKKDDTLPRSQEEILIEQYKYCDIQYFKNCVKLFYSLDKTKRIAFCEQNNSIIVRLQVFRIYTSSITNTKIYCGEWITIDGKNSFFADLELAIKEYENELSNKYIEENIAKLDDVFNSYPEYYAIIKWIKESAGGRKTIPYGNRYWPQIIVHGSMNIQHNHSIILRNINGIDKYKTMALIRYVFPGNPNDLKETLTFDVFEGNRKVASGKILSKRLNVDN